MESSLVSVNARSPFFFESVAYSLSFLGVNCPHFLLNYISADYTPVYQKTYKYNPIVQQFVRHRIEYYYAQQCEWYTIE